MPAKRIILLEYEDGRLTYALRADTPAGQEAAYRRPEYVSSYGDATDPDLLAIRDGKVIERVERNDFAPEAGEQVALFRQRVERLLEGRWAAHHAEVAARVPRRFFGRSWDGTAWRAL